MARRAIRLVQDLSGTGSPSGNLRSASFTATPSRWRSHRGGPRSGRTRVPPHSPPPSMPGNSTVPCRLGGSNSPALRSFSHARERPVRIWRPLRDEVFGEHLPRERRRQRGQPLRGERRSPGTSEAGYLHLLHRKDRFARLAVEDVGLAVLGDLRDDVAAATVLGDRKRQESRPENG